MGERLHMVPVAVCGADGGRRRCVVRLLLTQYEAYKKKENMRQGRILSLSPTSNGAANSEREDALARSQRADTFDPAPPSQRVPVLWWSVGLVATVALCVIILSF